jgi:hypothetical protein
MLHGKRNPPSAPQARAPAPAPACRKSVQRVMNQSQSICSEIPAKRGQEQAKTDKTPDCLFGIPFLRTDVIVYLITYL